MSVSDSSSDFASRTVCGYPIRRIESVWLCSPALDVKSEPQPESLLSRKGLPDVLAVGSVCDDDLGEILNWSIPRYDFLGGPRGKNLSFHPLPSGRYCLSCSFWAKDFPSALKYRRPEKLVHQRIHLVSADTNKPLAKQLNLIRCANAFPEETYGLYTHCMIVSQDTLGCFANHPFILFEALRRGRIGCQRPEKGRIAGSELSTDATIRSLVHSLSQFHSSPVDYESFLLLAQREDSVVVFGRENLWNWFSGLFNQIAPSRRLDYSFCTAAPFSPQRPFHITGIGKNRMEWRRLKRDYGQIPRWNVLPENTEKPPVKASDPDLIYLWRYLKESFWGDRDKFLQGIQLWKEYCQKNSSMVDSARESLLEWSVNAYQGIQGMQMKELRQMDAMMDMIDILLD